MSVAEPAPPAAASAADEPVPTTHHKGLALAVNVSDKTYAEKIRNSCRKAGLLITVQEEWLVFFPALNIDVKTAGKGLDILEAHIR